jgi:uncharacterized protein involved in exopolysaccharide biosynthesis
MIDSYHELDEQEMDVNNTKKDKVQIDDEVIEAFRKTGKSIKRYWWLLILGAIMSFALGVIFLNISTPKYSSEIIITEKVLPLDNGALSGKSVSSAFSFLTDEKGKVDSFDLFKETLKSANLANEFLANKQKLKLLLGPVYDESNNTLAPPNVLKSTIYSLVGREVQSVPDALYIQNALGKNLKVTEDKDNQIITIEYFSPDRDVSAELLAFIVDRTDNIVRKSIKSEIDENFSFINKELTNTYDHDLKKQITPIYTALLRLRMLSNTSGAYSYSLISSLKTSMYPTTPKISTTLAIAIFLGFVLSFLGAIIMGKNK